jgi:hypothetical protein
MKPKLELNTSAPVALKLIGCSASEDIHMNAIFSLSILGVAGFVTLATSCSIWLGSLRRI